MIADLLRSERWVLVRLALVGAVPRSILIMVGVAAPTRRRWAWASSALAVATTVAYVALISAEGNDPFWEVFPWVTLMLVGTGSALASALVRERSMSRAFAIGGAVVLGVIGLAAILSIGMGFVLAAVAAGVAATVSSPMSGDG